MAAVPESNEQKLRAALLWAGDDAAGAGRSAGEVYRLEGVRASRPEIVIPRRQGTRAPLVHVHRADDLRALMIREHRGWRVTGIEPTLLSLAHQLDGEAFEIACEDARRRRLTSVAALRCVSRPVRREAGRESRRLRALLDQLDPVHPSRSTLEVKTRRLLVAHRHHRLRARVPARVERPDLLASTSPSSAAARSSRRTDGAGTTIPPTTSTTTRSGACPAATATSSCFATWEKVTRHPRDLIEELRATLG